MIRKKIFLSFFLLSLGLFPVHCYAVSTDLPDILFNLRKVIPSLTILLMMISFVAGIYFIFRGLGMLKAFGMPLTQATRPGEVAGPLVYLIVGTILLYLPTTTSTFTKALMNDPSLSIFPGGGSIDYNSPGKGGELLAYSTTSVEAIWRDLMDTIVMYVQFIGFLAFVRGWFIVSHAGQPGTQPGSISKGVVHIVGGIMAVNFVPLVHVIHNTIYGT